MLELLHDSRSGRKLEIVIPTRNEENRIVGIINYYAPHFDVIILDDDSTDETQSRVMEAGGSVFRRSVKNVLSEAHFAYYVAEETRSGRCFWMFADEFVALSDLREADARLISEECHVLGQRIDWFYGVRLNSKQGCLPRGFRRGAAEHIPGSIHNALRCRSGERRDVLSYTVEVHHFHVTSVSSQLGTVGNYAALEIADFRRRPRPFLRFLRRFVISEVLLMPRKLWRERGKPWTLLLQYALLGLTASLAGLLCWIEAVCLPGVGEQRKQFAAFYRPEPDSESEPRIQP